MDIVAALRASPAQPRLPELLLAGATGALGNAVLRRLVGGHGYGHAHVLAREPVRIAMRQLSAYTVADDVAKWPVQRRFDVAVVMFEPARMFYQRERALWTPEPAQLPELARWLHRCGASSLAVILPHAQGSLPESLKRGLASLDEQALASIGFERLLILHSAAKPSHVHQAHPLDRLAQWMLGIFRLMVPTHEQAVRPKKIAEIVDALLHAAPPGITVVSPQEMWELSQSAPAHLPKPLNQRFDSLK